MILTSVIRGTFAASHKNLPSTLTVLPPRRGFEFSNPAWMGARLAKDSLLNLCGHEFVRAG